MCRVKEPWHMIYMVLQMLRSGDPDIVRVFSTATWLVRTDRDRNGARSDSALRQEAKDKMANNLLFDEEVVSRWVEFRDVIGSVVSSGASPLDPHRLALARWDLQEPIDAR